MEEIRAGNIQALQNSRKSSGKGPAFLSEEQTATAHRIHRELPGYQETPLVRLDQMAKRLGVRAVCVKDESRRFGLNAFKGLGGLYALTGVVCRALGLNLENVRFSDLQKGELREKVCQMVSVTATDGNHGKGIAWAAGQLGCKAHVYMPVGSSPLRAQAIRDVGKAEVQILETGYDDTVRYAAKMAKEHGWFLVQDTSWDGYEEIPAWIVQGYTTMVEEACRQMEEEQLIPTHVLVQAGVGAMAGGVTGYLVNRMEENRPVFGVVEPARMACIYQSAKVDDGAPHEAVGQGPTMMAGLNCGEPCTVTWPILRDFADWYFKCPDEVSAYGMRLLAAPDGTDPKVVSGESGAVTIGLLNQIAGAPEFEEIRQRMGLNETSVVLCFNTEGDTDPDHYRKVVYEGQKGK